MLLYNGWTDAAAGKDIKVRYFAVFRKRTKMLIVENELSDIEIYELKDKFNNEAVRLTTADGYERSAVLFSIKNILYVNTELIIVCRDGLEYRLRVESKELDIKVMKSINTLKDRIEVKIIKHGKNAFSIEKNDKVTELLKENKDLYEKIKNLEIENETLKKTIIILAKNKD